MSQGVSREDAKVRLGISLSQLDNYLELGLIRFSKIGRLIKIPESEIERALTVGLPALRRRDGKLEVIGGTAA